MIKIKWFMVIVGVLFLSNCSTTPKLTETKSGNPEVAINTTDIDLVKSAILAKMLDKGYVLEKDTKYLLEMNRLLTDFKETLAAGMLVGNAYSNNYRVVTYMFVVSEKEIRVVVSNSVRAILPGGLINSQTLDNTNIYNLYQNLLNDVKKEIENHKGQ